MAAKKPKKKPPIEETYTNGQMPKSVKDEFDMASQIMGDESKTQDADELIDYQTFEKNLNVKSQTYVGVRAIPLRDIVGSMGRYSNFNSKFLPKNNSTRDKILSVRAMDDEAKDFPPIKAYQVADNYFIVDGHHRVMISRERNKEFIDAEITKIEFDFELNSDKEYTFNTEKAKTLLIRLEGETFQRKTRLFNDMLRYPIRLTELSSYSKLYETILEQHHYSLIENPSRPFVLSSQDWYRWDFVPTVRMIIKENALRMFPNRTYGDLYVWIQIHRAYLSEKTGSDVDLEETQEDFLKKFGKDYFFNTLTDRVGKYLSALTGGFIPADQNAEHEDKEL